MSPTVAPYRWSTGEFVRAWEAGAFDHRVELVVELSDETLMADLTTKARVYGGAGWPVYWVVPPEAVYVHTDPHPAGYRQRTECRRGEQLGVPATSATLAVDDLLG